MRLIYLAAPYSDRNAGVRAKRVAATARAAYFLLAKGHHVFSPTVHGHHIDQQRRRMSGADISYSQWILTGLDFLERSDVLYVLSLPGWRQSTGVRGEVGRAMELNIPLFLLDHKNWKTLEFPHEQRGV